MRLLIDENVSPKIASRLRELGHDVKSISECCKGFQDEKVVEIAVKEDRIILTYDLDFGEIYRHFGASTIVIRTRSKNADAVIEYLTSFLGKAEKEKIDLKNKLAVLTEGRIRLIG
ncbi:MAG: DUF5615 family PIN-like protein [Thermodesulfovibrionales bacterium]|nr:DUF5615 family PIN-like protein [Thermodesulfovibrionales bacterium]